MDARTLVYRALRVPDILKDENKAKSAAARIAALEGLSTRLEPLQQRAKADADQFMRYVLNDAAVVLEVTIAQLAEGAFDEVLGGYPGRDKESLLRLIENSVFSGRDRLASDHLVPILAEALIGAIADYVADHPFFDPPY